MKLIVGLGNPGEKYENTRHNAGFIALDHWSGHFEGEAFKKSEKYKAMMMEGQWKEEKVILMKPLTFMNLSGHAVRQVMDFYKLLPEDLLVIYDDIAIDLGHLRLRPNGSSGGHNGIKSLIQELGTANFHRLRVGIKAFEPFLGELSDYVLGRFSDEEWEDLKTALEKILKAVELWVEEGIERAMNEVN